MGFLTGFFKAIGVTGSKINIVVVGLDNSGKTTIIESLKPKVKQSTEVAPTVGFHVDEFQKGSATFQVYDMSGASRYRSLWEQYYKEAQAVMFVIDSSDKLRLVVAKDELNMMLSHPQLNKVPIIFFANKRDLPTSLPAVEIAQTLGLEAIKDRPWQIMPSNALTGEGIEAGMDWLQSRVRK